LAPRESGFWTRSTPSSTTVWPEYGSAFGNTTVPGPALRSRGAGTVSGVGSWTGPVIVKVVPAAAPTLALAGPDRVSRPRVPAPAYVLFPTASLRAPRLFTPS